MDLQIIFVFGSVYDDDDVAVAIVMSYIDVAVATSSPLGRRCPPPCCLVALVVEYYHSGSATNLWCGCEEGKWKCGEEGYIGYTMFTYYFVTVKYILFIILLSAWMESQLSFFREHHTLSHYLFQRATPP